MALTVSENFDGVTAPATPSGWTFGSPIATTTSPVYSLNNSAGLSSGTASTNYFAMYSTGDAATNSWTIRAKIRMDVSGSFGGLVFGATSATPSAGSYYMVYTRAHTIGNQNRLRFAKVEFPTSEAQIKTAVPSNQFTLTQWYDMSVTGTYASGTTSIAVTLIDLSNNFYLDEATGDFQSGVTTALNSSDSGAIAPNFYGIVFNSSSGSGVYADDFTLNATTSSGGKIPFHLFFEAR
jgi:hypothetical protein